MSGFYEKSTLIRSACARERERERKRESVFVNLQIHKHVHLIRTLLSLSCRCTIIDKNTNCRDIVYLRRYGSDKDILPLTHDYVYDVKRLISSHVTKNAILRSLFLLILSGIYLIVKNY